MAATLAAEVKQIVRFGLVGGTATLVHTTVVVLTETLVEWPLIVVHGLGYLCAFSFSFVGHYIYTFASDRRWQLAFWRFFIVSLSALAASSVIAVGGHALGIPRLVGLLAAAASVPVFTFLASRRFAF
jgi:putative flippase GtrA